MRIHNPAVAGTCVDFGANEAFEGLGVGLVAFDAQGDSVEDLDTDAAAQIIASGAGFVGVLTQSEVAELDAAAGIVPVIPEHDDDSLVTLINGRVAGAAVDLSGIPGIEGCGVGIVSFTMHGRSCAPVSARAGALIARSGTGFSTEPFDGQYFDFVAREETPQPEPDSEAELPSEPAGSAEDRTDSGGEDEQPRYSNPDGPAPGAPAGDAPSAAVEPDAPKARSRRRTAAADSATEPAGSVQEGA